MSNVIGFLEQMGQDAHLRHAAGHEVEAALIRAGIELEARAAILDNDSQRLASLVGANSNVCCMVNVPEEEGDEEASG
jgi:hypothetical protein